MRDEEKFTWGLLGGISALSKGEGKTNFFSTFEYYGMRMGCLKFPSCSHERTDLRTKNKNHMEDGTG